MLSRVLLASAAVLVAVILLTAGSGRGAPASHAGCAVRSSHELCRVLFIGNSYTYVNSLPTVFAMLAASGDRRVATDALASPRETLAGHAAAPQTSPAISGGEWNVVVLQEQSEIPSIESLRQHSMYPPARTLVRAVRDAGARPVFFLTWAHRGGWPEMGLRGYPAMQAAVNTGYRTISRELGVTVAPVGVAWSAAVRRLPAAALWQEDGSHPTFAGTYLAACVFYATLFAESPVGLHYRGGIPRREALLLQTLAANAGLRSADQRPTSGSAPRR